MHKIQGIIILLPIVLLISSGDAFAQQSSDLPDWYLNPPADTAEYMYGTMHAEASKRYDARVQAEANAKQSIQSRVKIKFEVLQKLFESEVAGDYSTAFKNVEKTFTSRELKNTVIDFSYLPENEQGTYEVFLLLRVNVTDVLYQIERAFVEEQELYTLLKRSRAYKDFLNDFHRL